jgi:hypothetical protein
VDGAADLPVDINPTKPVSTRGFPLRTPIWVFILYRPRLENPCHELATPREFILARIGRRKPRDSVFIGIAATWNAITKIDELLCRG